MTFKTICDKCGKLTTHKKIGEGDKKISGRKWKITFSKCLICGENNKRYEPVFDQETK